MPTTQLLGENGYLQVRVNTASGALTVPGATVIISTRGSNGEVSTVLYSTVTDESGLTPKFALSAPPAYFSNTPDGPTPYLEYEVRVEKPMYFPMIYQGVPIFEKITTEQPVQLLPVPEGMSNPKPKVFPAYSDRQ